MPTNICPNCDCGDCEATNYCDGCESTICIQCYNEHNNDAIDHTAIYNTQQAATEMAQMIEDAWIVGNWNDFSELVHTGIGNLPVLDYLDGDLLTDVVQLRTLPYTFRPSK